MSDFEDIQIEEIVTDKSQPATSEDPPVIWLKLSAIPPERWGSRFETTLTEWGELNPEAEANLDVNDTAAYVVLHVPEPLAQKAINELKDAITAANEQYRPEREQFESWLGKLNI